MSATQTRGKRHSFKRPGQRRCPSDSHDYLQPLRERRPVVVFCTRCQTAKTIG